MLAAMSVGGPSCRVTQTSRHRGRVAGSRLLILLATWHAESLNCSGKSQDLR